MNNFVSQDEELLALQSIFDTRDLYIEDLKPPRGRFIVNVNLPTDFKVTYYKDTKTKEMDTVLVDHLPSLNLFFVLPETYPSDTCPAFLLSCCWLNLDQLSQVCSKLESLWENGYGEVVLFQWVNFLQEELLLFLNISDYLDISKIARYKRTAKNSNFIAKKNISCGLQIDSLNDNKDFSNSTDSKNSFKNSNQCVNAVKNVPNLKPNICRGSGLYDQRAVLDITSGLVSTIIEFNKFKKQEIFNDTWFTCQICFVSKKGIEFVPFSQCDHRYCRTCLTSYFEIQIKDGNVNALNCPEEKCDSQADGNQVKDLVSPELFFKYDSLLLSRTLDTMNDIAYCPRQKCQCAVLIEDGSPMGCCPACQFTFCILCRMVYHGVAPCNFKSTENQRICKEYLNSSGNDRLEMERRYGKKVLKLLSENVLSENWKEEHSKKCPHCEASIEKTEGCNKMTCFRCGLYFCWLCMEKLQASNPYLHFSNIDSSCYNRLFPPDEIFDDEEWIEPGEFLL